MQKVQKGCVIKLYSDKRCSILAYKFSEKHRNEQGKRSKIKSIKTYIRQTR